MNREAAEQIEQAALALRAFYDPGMDDRPDNVLWNYPSAPRLVEALKILIHILFPQLTPPDPDDLLSYFKTQLEQVHERLVPELIRALPFRWRAESARHEKITPLEDVPGEAERIASHLIARLPAIREILIDDVRAAYNGDPAALSYAEVKIAYPGVLAICSHRIAHELYQLDVPIIPRIMNEWTHARAGIDIHPGATIGRGFFIDHGTGVVIGETAHIGTGVKIYQGVTLGAKSFPLDEHGNPVKHVQRHPTVEDGVIIYANTTVLGGKTVIGHHAVVGGNVFLLESVPPYSFVTKTGGGVSIRTKDSDKLLGGLGI